MYRPSKRMPVLVWSRVENSAVSPQRFAGLQQPGLWQKDFSEASWKVGWCSDRKLALCKDLSMSKDMRICGIVGKFGVCSEQVLNSNRFKRVHAGGWCNHGVTMVIWVIWFNGDTVRFNQQSGSLGGSIMVDHPSLSAWPISRPFRAARPASDPGRRA